MLLPVTPIALTPPPSATTLSGLSALSVGLQAKPTLVLSIYPFGVLLRRMTDDGGETEYAISPAQLAEALAIKIKFETGLLDGNTLYIANEGTSKLVVEYRPPQRTALYLEGAETPVTVPLPGLVMARVNQGNGALRYGVYAVKQRPDSMDAPLFQPPLPNTGGNSICWGSVKRVSDQALAGNSLAEDWKLLIGSLFTSHNVGGKSRRCGNDVRQLLIALEKGKARKYPVSDMIPAQLTLGHWIGKSA